MLHLMNCNNCNQSRNGKHLQISHTEYSTESDNWKLLGKAECGECYVVVFIMKYSCLLLLLPTTHLVRSI